VDCDEKLDPQGIPNESFIKAGIREGCVDVAGKPR